MTKSSSTIDVIIPAYNEEKHIATCLNALTKQTYTKPYRIIVIDNNSSDNTKKIASSFPNVIVKTEKRKGYVYAVKTGVEKYSKASIVAQTDADTVVDAHWLQTIHDIFKRNPLLVACTGPIFYTDGSPIIRFFFNMINTIAPKLYNMSLSGMNMAYKRNVYDTAGGYDLGTNMSAEALLGIRMKQFGNIGLFRSMIVYSSLRRFATPARFLSEACIQSSNVLSILIRAKPLYVSNKDYR